MNAAATRGVAYGTSQATSNATFRRPMAVADVVMLRMSHAIRYVTSIDTVWNRHATVKNGAAALATPALQRPAGRTVVIELAATLPLPRPPATP